MIESLSKPKRERDAESAKAAILDGAEAVFAEHGFDGARIESIVKASGYNTRLLFQHFNDKLGLYVAVLKRADLELNALMGSTLTPWLSGEANLLDPPVFRAFVSALAGATFDYLTTHAAFRRILTWELADEWQTYRQIAPLFAQQFASAENEPVRALFQAAGEAGLLRSTFHPMVQLTLILNLCQAYCASLPLYQVFEGGGDLSSAAALAAAREYLIGLVVAGMLA